MNINDFGKLFIVATPIGNLQDMSSRAITILKEVNWIAAEDTRHSSSLMQFFSIPTPMLSLHEHNERERSAVLLERLQAGESIALISDAGTPLISDPGYYLVREARQLGITVVPIPGSCAAIAALSVSGLPTDRFVFEGFLPAKSKARVDSLTNLKYETRTMIFYEAPHRILDLLEDMQSVFGEDKQAVIARELTKVYETIRAGSLSSLLEWVKNDANQRKGEIVVVLEGCREAISAATLASQEILQLLMEKMPLKQAVELAAKITHERKNDLYQIALQIKNHPKL